MSEHLVCSVAVRTATEDDVRSASLIEAALITASISEGVATLIGMSVDVTPDGFAPTARDDPDHDRLLRLAGAPERLAAHMLRSMMQSAIDHGAVVVGYGIRGALAAYLDALFARHGLAPIRYGPVLDEADHWRRASGATTSTEPHFEARMAIRWVHRDPSVLAKAATEEGASA